MRISDWSSDVCSSDLESRDGRSARAGTGHSVMNKILRTRLHAAPRAWDFLSLALAVVTADVAVWRSESADGWTREIDLSIAVADPDFWNGQAAPLEAALKFLSTDRWRLRFIGGGLQPAPPRQPLRPREERVLLLAGGLDSLCRTIQ